VSIETTPGPISYLTLTFLRPKQATSLLDYIVEVSTTLMPLEWSSDPEYVEIVSVTDQGGGVELVKARSKIVIEPVPRQFLRVRAVPAIP
jgi:hypothetical protein